MELKWRKRERINCIYSLIIIFFNYEDKEVSYPDRLAKTENDDILLGYCIANYRYETLPIPYLFIHRRRLDYGEQVGDQRR